MIDFNNKLLKGFSYDEDMDEWSKSTFDGKLILWEKPNYTEWQLSYLDKEDYLHPISHGHQNDILSSLKAFDRDIKLSELLNS